jgi:hypothetical protein
MWVVDLEIFEPPDDPDSPFKWKEFLNEHDIYFRNTGKISGAGAGGTWIYEFASADRQSLIELILWGWKSDDPETDARTIQTIRWRASQPSQDVRLKKKEIDKVIKKSYMSEEREDT